MGAQQQLAAGCGRPSPSCSLLWCETLDGSWSQTGGQTSAFSSGRPPPLWEQDGEGQGLPRLTPDWVSGCGAQQGSLGPWWRWEGKPPSWSLRPVLHGVYWEGLSQEVPRPLGFQLQHWLWALLPCFSQIPAGQSRPPAPEPRCPRTGAVKKTSFRFQNPSKFLLLICVAPSEMEGGVLHTWAYSGQCWSTFPFRNWAPHTGTALDMGFAVQGGGRQEVASFCGPPFCSLGGGRASSQVPFWLPCHLWGR